MITTNNSSEILVLGIGNTLLGDEGIGCYIAQALSDESLGPNVRCLDGGTGGLHLLGEFENAVEAVMIDAVADGQPVGTITRLTPHFAADYPRTLVAHDIGLKDLLDALQIVGSCPKITLFAISINFPLGVSGSLSPELEKLVPTIVEEVKMYVGVLAQIRN